MEGNEDLHSDWNDVKEEAIECAEINTNVPPLPKKTQSLYTDVCSSDTKEGPVETETVNGASPCVKWEPFFSFNTESEDVKMLNSDPSTNIQNKNPGSVNTRSTLAVSVETKTVTSNNKGQPIHGEMSSRPNLFHQKQSSTQSSSAMKPIKNSLAASYAVPVKTRPKIIICDASVHGAKRVQRRHSLIHIPVHSTLGAMLDKARTLTVPAQTFSQRISMQTLSQRLPVPRPPQTLSVQSLSQGTSVKVMPQVLSVPTLPQTVPVQTLSQGTSVKAMPQVLSVPTLPQTVPVQTFSQVTSVKVIPQVISVSRMPQTVPVSLVSQGTSVKVMPLVVSVPTLPQTVPVQTLSQGTSVKVMPHVVSVPRLPQTVPVSLVSLLSQGTSVKAMPHVVSVPKTHQTVVNSPIIQNTSESSEILQKPGPLIVINNGSTKCILQKSPYQITLQKEDKTGDENKTKQDPVKEGRIDDNDILLVPGIMQHNLPCNVQIPLDAVVSCQPWNSTSEPQLPLNAPIQSSPSTAKTASNIVLSKLQQKCQKRKIITIPLFHNSPKKVKTGTEMSDPFNERKVDGFQHAELSPQKTIDSVDVHTLHRGTSSEALSQTVTLLQTRYSGKELIIDPLPRSIEGPVDELWSEYIEKGAVVNPLPGSVEGPIVDPLSEYVKGSEDGSLPGSVEGSTVDFLTKFVPVLPVKNSLKEEVIECEEIDPIVPPFPEKTHSQYTYDFMSDVTEEPVEFAEINPSVPPLLEKTYSQYTDDLRSEVKEEAMECEEINTNVPSLTGKTFTQYIHTDDCRSDVKEEAVGEQTVNDAVSSVKLEPFFCLKPKNIENTQNLQTNFSINSAISKPLPLETKYPATKVEMDVEGISFNSDLSANIKNINPGSFNTTLTQSVSVETSTQAVPLNIICLPIRDHSSNQPKFELILRAMPHQQSFKQVQCSIQSSSAMEPVQNLLETVPVHSTSTTSSSAIPVEIKPKSLKLNASVHDHGAKPMQIRHSTEPLHSTSSVMPSLVRTKTVPKQTCSQIVPTLSQRFQVPTLSQRFPAPTLSQRFPVPTLSQRFPTPTLSQRLPAPRPLQMTSVQSLSKGTSVKVMPQEVSVPILPKTVPLPSMSQVTSIKAMPQLLLSAPALPQTVPMSRPLQTMPVQLLSQETSVKVMPQVISEPTLPQTAPVQALSRGTSVKVMPQVISEPTLPQTALMQALSRGTSVKVMPQVILEPTLPQAAPMQALSRGTSVQVIPQVLSEPTLPQTASVQALSRGTPVKVMLQVVSEPTLSQTVPVQALFQGTQVKAMPQVISELTLPQTVPVQALLQRTPVKTMPQVILEPTLPQTVPVQALLQRTPVKTMPQVILEPTLPQTVPVQALLQRTPVKVMPQVISEPTLPQAAPMQALSGGTSVKVMPQVISEPTLPQTAPVQALSRGTPVKVMPQVISEPTLPQAAPMQALSRGTSVQVMPQVLSEPTLPQTASVQALSRGTPVKVMPQVVSEPTLSQTVPVQALFQGTPVKAMPQVILEPTLPQTVPVQALLQRTPVKAMPQVILEPTLPQTVPVQALLQRTPVKAMPQVILEPSLPRTVPVQALLQRTPVKAMPQVISEPTLPQTVHMQTVSQGVSVKVMPQEVSVPTLPQTVLVAGQREYGNTYTSSYWKLMELPVTLKYIQVNLTDVGSICKECNQELSSPNHYVLMTCNFCPFSTLCIMSMTGHQKSKHGPRAKLPKQLKGGYGYLTDVTLPKGMVCGCKEKWAKNCNEMARHLSRCTKGSKTCRFVNGISDISEQNESDKFTVHHLPGDVTDCESLASNSPDLSEQKENDRFTVHHLPESVTKCETLASKSADMSEKRQDDKSFVIGCGLCDVKCSSYLTLSQHLKYFHPAKYANGAICLLCDIGIVIPTFYDPFINLKSHQSRYHDGKHLIYGKLKATESSHKFANCGILKGKKHGTEEEMKMMLDKAVKILNEIGFTSRIENLKQEFDILKSYINDNGDQTGQFDSTPRKFVLIAKKPESVSGKQHNPHPVLIAKKPASVSGKQQNPQPLKERMSYIYIKCVSKEEFQKKKNTDKSYRESFSEEHVNNYYVCMWCNSKIAEQPKISLFNLKSHQNNSHGGKYLIYGKWKECQSLHTLVYCGILKGKHHGTKEEMEIMLDKAVKILSERDLISEEENLKKDFSEIMSAKDLVQIQDPLICMHNMCGKEFTGENRKSLIYAHLYEHWHSEETEHYCPQETKDDSSGDSTPKLRTKNEIDRFLRQILPSCNLCNKKLEKDQTVKAHLMRHHIRVKCSVCRKVLLRRSIQGHMQIHEQNGKWQCDKCGRVFKNCRSLQHHQRQVCTSLMCEFCGVIVKRRNYNNHIRVHENKQSFKCVECGNGFNTPVEKCKHINYIHRKINVVRCFICGRKCRQENLPFHMTKCHRNNFECDICNTKFMKLNSLQTHVGRIHFGRYSNVKNSSGENNVFLCSLCGKTMINSRTNYRRHMESHNVPSPSFHCEICDKNFKSKSYLNAHNAISHPTNVNRYTCTYCHKNFPYKAKLTRHVKTKHLKQKNVQCTLCNYKCYDSYMLKSHMRFRHKVTAIK